MAIHGKMLSKEHIDLSKSLKGSIFMPFFGQERRSEMEMLIIFLMLAYIIYLLRKR